MVIATLFILLFALMLVGVPVAVALGATTLVTAFFLQTWI
jgi:C4-dicarboxylate transporter DctM subunit